MHCKVELEDADIEEQYKEQFTELCMKFTDIFIASVIQCLSTNN